MALFDDVNRKLEALGNSVTAIGNAADEKGATIDVETTPLDEWADAIRAIPVPTPVWEANASTNQLKNMHFQSSLTYPTQASDGTPLSTTFYPSADAARIGVQYFDTVIIPEYFTQVDVIIPSLSNYTPYAVKYLEIHATGSVNWEYTRYWENLQKIYCATRGTFYLDIRPKNKLLTELGGAVVIDIPNATSIYGPLWGREGSGEVDRFVINAPNVTIFPETTSSNVFGRYWCGDNTFPKLKDIAGLTSNPNYTGYTNTIRVPKLTKLSRYFMKNAVSGGGKLVLYVGPNLTSIHSDPLGRIPTQIANGILEIHIPAGDSPTKTYLDTNGITYIQDYEIDS